MAKKGGLIKKGKEWYNFSKVTAGTPPKIKNEYTYSRLHILNPLTPGYYADKNNMYKNWKLRMFRRR